MIGVEGATAAVVDRIDHLIKPKMLELRQRLDDPNLPDVNSVTAFDDNRIPIQKWPAIMVVPQTTPKMTWAGTNGVDEQWTVRYKMQAFVWVRGTNQLDVAINRYRITLGLRELLLASRRFEAFELDITTFQESYSDVMVDKATEATIAGSWIQFEMTADETLRTGSELGTVQTTHVNTGLVPPHPALS